jgi:phytoene dehydrogenase-like protein
LPLEAPADFLRNLRLARGLAPALPWLLRGGLHSFGEILDQWNPSPEFRAWVEMNLLITLQAPTSEVHPLWGALGIFFYALDAGALDGGMRGLFENSLRAAQAHARVRVFMRTPVSALRWRDNRWLVETPDGARGPFDLVVSAIPRWNTERLLGSEGAVILGPRARWDEVAPRLWGAIVAYAVVRDDASFPEAPFNHHSRLEEDPLDGGEAYMSFSRRGDLERAPEGYRTVTISSHTRLRAWQNFLYVGRGVRKRLAPGAPVPDPEYVVARDAAGERLIRHLENAYPGVEIVFREFGTPRTFERYTGRREGSVGGIPMTRDFTLFNSLPLRTRHERLWQIGDTSFPGQSVYACTLGACAAFEQMSGRRPDWLA